MSAELVFYTNPMSRGRIARWMLEEVGVPYRTELLDYGTTMKAPAYLAVNPMGKVPAIRHGETIVTEAAAVCAYLADAFPAAGLAPAVSSPERGPYYRWMFFAAGPIEALMTNTALGVNVPTERRAMVGYGCREDVFAGIDRALVAAPYLLGDRFSAADVYFGSALGWGIQFGIIEKRPLWSEYVARLQSRPAAVRASEIDDALMPPPKPKT